MVHSAGVGRTGTFIVIDTMMEKLEDNEPIDIYSCVVSLRTRRQDMVQTEVCKCVLDCNTYQCSNSAVIMIICCALYWL